MMFKTYQRITTKSDKYHTSHEGEAAHTFKLLMQEQHGRTHG